MLGFELTAIGCLLTTMIIGCELAKVHSSSNVELILITFTLYSPPFPHPVLTEKESTSSSARDECNF
jgi:hypothetical protein